MTRAGANQARTSLLDPRLVDWGHAFADPHFRRGFADKIARRPLQHDGYGEGDQHRYETGRVFAITAASRGVTELPGVDADAAVVLSLLQQMGIL